MITEATEILEVMEAAKGAPPLLPGLPASEYPSGELWECSDQAELLYAQRSEGGCTADQEFFRYLRNSFNPSVSGMAGLNKNHRTFPGLHDEWWIGTKR